MLPLVTQNYPEKKKINELNSDDFIGGLGGQGLGPFPQTSGVPQ